MKWAALHIAGIYVDQHDTSGRSGQVRFANPFIKIDVYKAQVFRQMISTSSVMAMKPVRLRL